MMMRGNGRRALRTGVAALAIAAAVPALAQDAATPPADEPEAAGSGNEIVITARQFEERLQDVPITVSALGAEDLQRQQLDDLSDVAEKTVGFAFESFTGAFTQPVIRGQTNLRTTSPVQNVATYLNGVYIQRGYFIDQSLLDLERVEIVKGPQSALYGRNAFSGVINLVARTPDLDEFSGRVSGTVGTDERYDAEASFNFPVVPGVFAVFGSVAHSQFDGTWRNNHPLADADGDNAFTSGKVNGYNREAYQFGAKLKIADKVTLEGLYVRTERELEQTAAYTLTTAGLTYAFNTLNESSVTLGTGPTANTQNRLWVGELPVDTPLFPGTAAVPGETRLPGLVIDPRSYGLRGPSEVWIGKATLDTGGPFTINYTYGRTEANIVSRGSSARDALLPTILDLDGPGPLPPRNYGTVFDASGTESGFVSDSHEGRVTFDAGRLTGFVGVNFTETSDAESNAAEFAPSGTLEGTDPCSLFPLGPGLQIPSILTCLFKRNTFLVRDENIFSVFGFLDWRPSDKLAITIEGRYTEENQKAVDLVAAQPGNPAILSLNPPRLQREDSFFAPRGTIAYKFTPDNNIYASVARGIKSGGINSFVPFEPQRTYEPETNWTYEIGTKNSFFGRRLQLNLAAYYTDWKNVQTNAVRLNAGGVPPNFAAIVPSLIGNVGDVEVYGVEVEGVWRVFDELRINFGASYNRARYADDVVSQRFGASGNCDGVVCAPVNDPNDAFTFAVLPIGGNQLERTPEFDALLGATFETEFSNSWKFFARADVTYQTKQYVDEANLAFLPDRTLVNASLGLEIGPVDLNLWVKNLFDEKYVSSALFLIGTGGAGSASYVPILGEQRTAGLTATFSF